jgi:hypothetical protein
MCAVATGSLPGGPPLYPPYPLPLSSSSILIEEGLQSGAATGYPLTRLLAHMEWALLDKPGVAGLLEYDTRLNYGLPKLFVPPDQFLLEIRERRSARQSARMAS